MAELPWANWNGEQMPLGDVRVSVLDRAFLFGDAIYEAMRIYSRRPFLEPRHFARLRRSLAKVRIDCDVDRLQQRMHETIDGSEVQEGLVYIQVTRGEAPRTHAFPNPPAVPNELIYVLRYDEPPHADVRETGAAVVTVTDTRWRMCDVKSVNLLANCLAAQTAAEAGATEAVMVTDDGNVTEGSHTSFFGVKDGAILTASLERNILPGITRGLLCELANQAQIPLRNESLTKASLRAVDELFLTGTTAAVLPVTRLDGQPVGDGRPGPITRRLVTAYHDYVHAWLEQAG